MKFQTLDDVEFEILNNLLKGFAGISIRSSINDYLSVDSIQSLFKSENPKVKEALKPIIEKQMKGEKADIDSLKELILSDMSILLEMSKMGGDLKLLFEIGSSIIDYFKLEVSVDDLDDAEILKMIWFLAKNIKNNLQSFLELIEQRILALQPNYQFPTLA